MGMVIAEFVVIGLLVVGIPAIFWTVALLMRRHSGRSFRGSPR